MSNWICDKCGANYIDVSHQEPSVLRQELEIRELKELLREWMHFYPIILYEHEDTLKTKDIVELYDKTREVLK